MLGLPDLERAGACYGGVLVPGELEVKERRSFFGSVAAAERLVRSRVVFGRYY